MKHLLAPKVGSKTFPGVLENVTEMAGLSASSSYSNRFFTTKQVDTFWQS